MEFYSKHDRWNVTDTYNACGICFALIQQFIIFSVPSFLSSFVFALIFKVIMCLINIYTEIKSAPFDLGPSYMSFIISSLKTELAMLI